MGNSREKFKIPEELVLSFPLSRNTVSPPCLRSWAVPLTSAMAPRCPRSVSVAPSLPGDAKQGRDTGWRQVWFENRPRPQYSDVLPY